MNPFSSDIYISSRPSFVHLSVSLPGLSSHLSLLIYVSICLPIYLAICIILSITTNYRRQIIGKSK